MFYRMRNGSCGSGEGGEGRRGRGRFGRRGGGEGRGSRMFEQGDLRLVILALVADAPRHGYDIIREIEARVGGAYAPSPGVVYPTLTLLEEMGLIAAQAAEGSKRLYAVTDAGRDYLAERAEQVERLMARMSEVRSEAERGDIAPVIRAMANLRNALRLRLLRGEADGETIRKATLLIDELAAKVDTL